MKYDNELFLLSEFFSHNTINKKDSREISDKKRKLFRIVLKEFRKETNLQEGFCKIKFMDRFWGECDKGYTLVKELVENDAFKSFSKVLLPLSTGESFSFNRFLVSYIKEKLQ
jgi:hypothetical protein